MARKVDLLGNFGEFSGLLSHFYPYGKDVVIVIRARNAWQPFVLSA